MRWTKWPLCQAGIEFLARHQFPPFQIRPNHVFTDYLSLARLQTLNIVASFESTNHIICFKSVLELFITSFTQAALGYLLVNNNKMATSWFRQAHALALKQLKWDGYRWLSIIWVFIHVSLIIILSFTNLFGHLCCWIIEYEPLKGDCYRYLMAY